MPTLDLDSQTGNVPATGGSSTDFIPLSFSGQPTISNDGSTLEADGVAETARYSDVGTIDGQPIDLIGRVISAERLNGNGDPNGQDFNPRLNNAQLDGDGSANLNFAGGANGITTIEWMVVASGTDTPVSGNFAVLLNDLDGNGNLTRYERVTVEKDAVDSYALEADPANPTNIQVFDNGDSLTFQPNDNDPGTPGFRPDNSVALTFTNTSTFEITYEKLNTGGNVGLDGTFATDFFNTPTVTDTNPDYGSIFTEDGAPAALTDPGSLALDTEGVGFSSYSITPGVGDIEDGADEVFVLTNDDGTTSTVPLDGSDTGVKTLTVNGEVFNVQYVGGSIEITAADGAASDADAAEALTRLGYENTSDMPVGTDPTLREFEIVVEDLNGDTSPPATSTVTVVGVNEAPTAVDDTISAAPGSGPVLINVTDNDTDPDGDALVVNSVTDGASGTVSIDGNGQVTYTPDDSNFVGQDTFTYTVIDAGGETSTATVTVMICFCEGTLIDTEHGPVAVEELVPGMKVRTQDNGMQTLRWLGQTEAIDRPVRIKKGAMGNTRDLCVSPRHRMVVDGDDIRLFFEEPQVLVPALELVNGDTVVREPLGPVQYFHLLFDRHEIVFAEGAASESFHPDQPSLGMMAEETRAELFALFPELAEGAVWKPAVPQLSPSQTAFLTRNFDLHP